MKAGAAYLRRLGASWREWTRRGDSFRLLFESNPVPMWVFDRRSLRFLAVNEAAVDHYGYSRDDFLSKTLLDIRPAEEHDLARQAVQSIKGAYEADRVWRHLKADGTEIQVLSYGRALAYHGHQALLTAVIDITAQKQAEEELRTRNLCFDAAVNNMAQGLAMFDGARNLIICNTRYAEVYGLPPELMRPGTTQRQILEHRVAAGTFAGSDPEQYIRDRVANADDAKPSTKLLELGDGRTILVSHRPMPDGGWVSTHEDITERRRAETQIAHMARHDALTDLPNRVLFRERMDEALARVRRHGESVAVLCLDLDHFKSVNDSLGHPVGDALLQEVATRLRACIRDTDTAARLSGDEFAIVQVALARPEDASALAERIVEALGRPYDLDGHEVLIGVSIGIATAPDDGTDPDQVLKHADMALYRAKADGRGTYRFFEPEMDVRAQTRRSLELDLRSALAHGQFELYYQPLVSLERNEVSGFEALLRWHHPQRGIVSPAEFIPLAEEIGLIVPLGDWVLRQACAEAATWPGEIKIAVNLSPAQFKNRSLIQAVVSALAASRLAATRLELEITESVLLEDSEATLATLHQLRALGIRISMDDFGTGYSSLSYLRSFPFDKIKIDRSFVRDLSDTDDSAAIVRAVAGLGTSLGMATTAEGVETREQLEKIRAEGCTEVQGFYFSPPRPASELADLIARLGKADQAAA